ncbi:MAG: hypothetical protein ACXWK8_07685 [Myxococcaceae bacterium]
MSAADAVLEPLRGKGRTVRQALTEVAERWVSGPLEGTDGTRALEDAVRHLLRRGVIRRELPPTADTGALSRAFVRLLVEGRGRAAVEAALATEPAPPIPRR